MQTVTSPPPGARGFATGRLYNQAGSLVASVAQEGLIRPVGLELDETN